jgi:hypothetical protein
MTIQRQYSLPNCTLVLDGLGDGGMLMNAADTRPLMSMLINAEFRLPGKEPLAGGREFFESLVQAVSRYVQEVLSGIHAASPELGPVQLHRIDAHHHRLSVAGVDGVPQDSHRSGSHQSDSQTSAQGGQQVLLSTVELFDLVEAIDQFLADARTLPDLALSLKPVSKRYVSSGRAMNQQVVPAAVGLSGLAAAAIAFAMIPAPKIQEPADLVGRPTTTAEKPVTPGASPTPSPSPTGSPAAAPPDLAKLEAQFSAAPEIKDAAQLDELRRKVSSQLEAAWQKPPLAEALVYRIGVGADGAIVGYKAVSPTAAANAKQTPLVDLPYNQNRATSEPLAQFKVTFTPEGTVNVTPWGDGSAATGQSLGQVTEGTPLEITDAVQLKALQPKVYDQILPALSGASKFPEDLVYRVRVQADGAVVDYLPDNQPARDHDKDLGMSKVGALANDSAPQQSLAWFKAVIKPDGTLEVSPWRGTN